MLALWRPSKTLEGGLRSCCTTIISVASLSTWHLVPSPACHLREGSLHLATCHPSLLSIYEKSMITQLPSLLHTSMWPAGMAGMGIPTNGQAGKSGPGTTPLPAAYTWGIHVPVPGGQHCKTWPPCAWWQAGLAGCGRRGRRALMAPCMLSQN